MANVSIPWPSTRPTLMLGIQDARNEAAWSTFLDLYLSIVLNYCRKRGLQEADAQDVTQTVIERVRRFIHRYDPSAGRFRGWLARIAQNEIKRHHNNWTKGRAHGGLDHDEGDDGIDTLEAGSDLDWERVFNAHLLESALERIQPEFKEKEWKAFEAVAYRVEQTPQCKVLVSVDKPQYARVAAELDERVGWVYKVKSRIKKRLEQEILYLADEMALFL
jgi:RNA polymerase sigma-70 factor, ECF subfamily